MSSRQWEEYSDKRHPSRDLRRDFSQKYFRDGHDSRSKDPPSRDHKRSSERRRASSPDWEAPDNKRFAEETNYRFRRESVGAGPSLDRDYRDADFRTRRMSPDSRHAYRHHDGPSSDSTYRRPSDAHRSRDYAEDPSAARNVKPRERSNSPAVAAFREERPHERSNYGENGSDRQTFPGGGGGGSGGGGVSSSRAAVPLDTSSRGFERFLHVLNKGVNVHLLTKIVTQVPSAAVPRRPLSPVSSAAARPWSPCPAEVETWDLHRPTSPRFSLQRFPLSEEEPPPPSDANRRSSSPSDHEEALLTPEEAHKRRQMQDVLQAIGVDLGLEELGQMSNRIQERLYGRRDAAQGRKASREGGARRERSPKRRSRSSSSSRSTFTPFPRDGYGKRASHGHQREESDPETEPPPSNPDVESEASKPTFIPPPFHWSPVSNPHWNPAPACSPSAPPNPHWGSPPGIPGPPPRIPGPPPRIPGPPPRIPGPPPSVLPPYSPRLFPPPFPPPIMPNLSPRFFPPHPPPPHPPHPPPSHPPPPHPPHPSHPPPSHPPSHPPPSHPPPPPPPPQLPPSPFPQTQPSSTFSALGPFLLPIKTKPKAQPPRSRCLQEITLKK